MYQATATVGDAIVEARVFKGKKDWLMKVGQRWKDCDKRVGHRVVEVVSLETREMQQRGNPMGFTELYARCKIVEYRPSPDTHSPGVVAKSEKHLGRIFEIRCDRMHPNSTGWELVQ